jgi:uncharacterized protein (DUF2235 family)
MWHHPKQRPGFREANSYKQEHIKFIGVWDTVGSVGIPLQAFQWWNKIHYGFYDTRLSSIVDFAYHALAVDEKRGNFKPTLWHQSNNLHHRTYKQVLEQCWFRGVHSNIGGGYPDEGLSDITLQWMIENARRAGLAFYDDLVKKRVKPNVTGTLHDSLSGIYTILPKYPRKICKTNDGNESVHLAVGERLKKTGEPLPQNLK